MGPKITIDSSTLMNKAFEVIEAHELFGVDYDRIDVVVHPQSVVHSMVEFTDGRRSHSSFDARHATPDRAVTPSAIRTDRHPFSAAGIDWSSLSRLDFEPPDTTTFRCLGLAYDAGRAGGTAPAWLSAANEVAVDAFLENRLRWADIAAVCATVLDAHDGAVPDTVAEVIDADETARRRAAAAIDATTRS
ncbi:MAG: hypothetical protein R2697_06185 [Ilumatobacteraceae bacterium]